MYYTLQIEHPITNETTEHICRVLPDGAVETFPNVDTNDGPERAAYLAWVEAGNTPEPWEPSS